MSDRVIKSDDEWRRLLTPEQYRVTRQKGTEPPFSGEYWDHKGKGTYACICCGNELFRSEARFESGTGWPSFWQAVSEGRVGTSADHSLWIERS